MYRYMGFILFCSVISNSIDMELYRGKENKKTILSIDDASKKIKSIIKECNNA